MGEDIVTNIFIWIVLSSIMHDIGYLRFTKVSKALFLYQTVAMYTIVQPIHCIQCVHVTIKFIIS